jgi:hypothetical protein
LAGDSYDLEPFGNESGRWRKRVQVALLAATFLAGAVITLYRNDLTLGWAKAVDRGSAYLDVERRWFGGAPAGTPREINTFLGRTTPEEASPQSNSLVSATMLRKPSPPEVAVREKKVAQATAPAQTSENATDTAEDSVQDPPTPAAPDMKSAKSVEDLPVQAGRRSRSRSSGAPRARVESRSVSSSHQRPSSAEKAEEPKQEPPKKADKQALAPGSDAFLRASILDAVERSGDKKKKKRKNSKKSKKSSYDPLNGEI